MKCEVCFKDDVETQVVNAPGGPYSKRMCYICAAMNADDGNIVKEFGLDLCNWYDHENDCYRNIKDVLIPILTKDGKEFNTRNEYVKSIKI